MIKNEFNHIYVHKDNKEKYISDYGYVLDSLESKLNIDKKVIHNLIELKEYFYSINDLKIVKNKNVDIYVIGNNCKLNERAEKEKSYILANYLLYDNNFSIKKDHQETYNQENYLCNKNNKFNILLKENKELNKIELLIELKKDLLIPYDVEILNENEQYKLKYIKVLQELNLYEYIVKRNGNRYALFLIEIIYEKSLMQNIQSMYNQIKLIYSDFENKVNKYTEDNKLIFQRALTEIQIKDF